MTNPLRYLEVTIYHQKVLAFDPAFHATNYTLFLGIDKKGAMVAKLGNRRSSFVEDSSFNYRIMGTFTEI